jgi:hypothetical protein
VHQEEPALNFHANLQPPDCIVAIEDTTRTGLSKDTFGSVLTIQKKDTVQFKNKSYTALHFNFFL